MKKSILRLQNFAMDKKRIISLAYPVVLMAIIFGVWKYREGKKPRSDEMVHFKGITMGVIQYNVLYRHEDGIDFSMEVDSLLKVWNESLSTYIPDSEISRFNQDSCFAFESKYFYPVLASSKRVYESTGGAFDPTVGPLVNAWGFGPDDPNYPDSSKVDSLKNFIGFSNITFDEENVCKSVQGVQLDFSAIAKGYAVDVVAEFLKSKGIENLLVEIGGELICFGDKGNDNPWVAGIEDPDVEIEEQKLLAKISLKDRAMATSGNYRNYYIKDGVKYSHTINPSTGYPIQRNILSATVFAEDCMTADAYATAFMVLGVEGAKKVLTNTNGIEAFLVYSDEKGAISHFSTDDITPLIEIVNGQ